MIPGETRLNKIIVCSRIKSWVCVPGAKIEMDLWRVVNFSVVNSLSAASYVRYNLGVHGLVVLNEKRRF